MIAGIDFSSFAVDVILLDETSDAYTWHRFDLREHSHPKADAFDRSRAVREAMPARGWWDDEGVIAVGIEQPRGRFGVTPLFRVQGAVLACLPADLLVQPWNPASWRIAVGLAGNATKQDVMLRGLELLPAMPGRVWPQDAYDALCMAHATRAAIHREAAA